MSATDEMRRMLDERGVKHEDEDYRLCGSTKWKCDFGKAEFYEDHTNRFTMLSVDYDDDMTCLTIRSDLKPPERYVTPEQAIAATMGRETCYDTSVMQPVEALHPSDGVVCKRCGMAFMVTRLDVEDGYLISDDEFECVPNYCPRCGAEVVE